MRKKWIALIGVALSVVLCFGATACAKETPSGEKRYDTENVALRLALEGQDGVFSPFFATTAYDSEVAGQTQIGMLATDPAGKITYGEDEPVVTLDYTQKMYTDGYTTSTQPDSGTVTADGTKAARTEYRFLLKNGIKFSDGTPLTIKDVLFTLYVYLDPAYTGSMTIYSSKIYGLEAYRTQQKNATEDDAEAFEQSMNTNVDVRVRNAANYIAWITDMTGDKLASSDAQIVEAHGDLQILQELYRDELRQDYQTAKNSLEDYRKEYTIDTVYEAFLYLEGVLKVKMVGGSSSAPVKDDQGRFVIDEEARENSRTEMQEYLAAHEGETDPDTGAAMTEEALIEQWATEKVFRTNLYDANRIDPNWDDPDWESEKKDELKADIVSDTGYASNAAMVMNYSASATTFRSRLLALEKEKWFNEHSNDPVENISGITTQKTKTFNGKTYQEEHDVLTINIRKVDPKAIWNFAFGVAPMHYYSTPKAISEYNGTTKFGVVFNNDQFMQTDLRAKIGVPLGAGPYRASKIGGLGANQTVPDKSEFLNSNVIYFERNPYFYTAFEDEETGKDTSHNAKIKFLTYQVTSTDQIVSALKTHSIDMGMPSAKTETVTDIDKTAGLAHKEIQTNGYGYIGVNAKYVPNVWVRRMIMRAMDTTLITKNYYTGNLGELIYRPMSKTSWAYPKEATTFQATSVINGDQLDYSFDANGSDILEMLETYASDTVRQVTGSDGKKVMQEKKNGTWQQISYTFTIPGATNDHPVAKVFEMAAETLNAMGCNIKIKTDNFALISLASGKLAIWAAAWSSTIDPDMYQVYHKDSKASSVLNWGYPEILANIGGVYDYEKALVEELSTLIDDGRATIDDTQRVGVYHEALDVLMELAVEFPTYQRCDMTVYNSTKIDRNSLQPEKSLTAYNGLFARIWEVDYL